MIVRATGYVKAPRAAARAKLSKHLKYIEHRRMDEEREDRDGRRFFSKDEDLVNRHAALTDLMEHTSNAVAYHKLVFSPTENEPVENWHEWTRNIMADLQKKQGKELHWYAVRHRNTQHDHVHVVLAGSGEKADGRMGVIKLMQPDLALLRESGRTHSEHDWHEMLQDIIQELDRHDERGSMHDRDGMNGLFEGSTDHDLQEGWEH